MDHSEFINFWHVRIACQLILHLTSFIDLFCLRVFFFDLFTALLILLLVVSFVKEFIDTLAFGLFFPILVSILISPPIDHICWFWLVLSN